MVSKGGQNEDFYVHLVSLFVCSWQLYKAGQTVGGKWQKTLNVNVKGKNRGKIKANNPNSTTRSRGWGAGQ